jgi:hypothetical protein
LDYKIKRPIPIYQAIPLELLAGSGITFLSGLTGAFIGWALTPENADGMGIAIITAYALIGGYYLGFPSGVYLVAKNINPDLSYWATLGFSIGFTAATTYLSFTIFPNDHNHPTRAIAYLSPIIGSILYANFLAPKNSNNQSISNTSITNQNLSHKDLYNSTMLFKINLVRLNF